MHGGTDHRLVVAKARRESRQRQALGIHDGCVLMTGMIFVGKVQDPYTALALICRGGFAHQVLSISVITMASDLFREE